MITVNAIVAEFRKTISPLPVPNKAFALVSLILAFEAVKLFFEHLILSPQGCEKRTVRSEDI
jgi:hypothetical protein